MGYQLLRCDRELSAGDPDAGNLLVQGENLRVLNALLPYYAGKAKCIPQSVESDFSNLEYFRMIYWFGLNSEGFQS